MDIEVFDRVLRKVLEMAMRKKEIPVLVTSMIRLCEGAKIVRVDGEFSGEFEVKVLMHQRSMLSPFLFPLVDVVIELAREGI